MSDLEYLVKIVRERAKEIESMSKNWAAFANSQASKDLADTLNRSSEAIRTLVDSPALGRLQDDLQRANDSVARMANSMSTLKLNLDWDRWREFLTAGLPPNWVDLGISTEELVDFMQDTQWCLVWVPRASVIKELLGADVESRGEVLLANADQIIQDARSVLETVESPELQDVREATCEVADSLQRGFNRAAQALAASCLTDLIQIKYGMTFLDVKDHVEGADLLEVAWIHFQRFVVLSLVAAALQTYRTDQGDPIPATFSRHASAHTVSGDQYQRENAVAGLMLVTAFLMEGELEMSRLADE